jgi:V8-like Glu-specific endopeptidase
MSQGGDSGSAVLDEKNQLVGLLFAGSDTTTIINRIENVFSALGVTL